MSIAEAKKLQSIMTDAERRLWLRAHRFDRPKFKRQIPIGPYVVDLACLNRKLVVEVDGGQQADNLDHRRRGDGLRQQGFHGLRFWKNEVLSNTNGVLESILTALVSRPSAGALRAPPSPPAGGEGKVNACR